MKMFEHNFKETIRNYSKDAYVHTIFFLLLLSGNDLAISTSCNCENYYKIIVILSSFLIQLGQLQLDMFPKGQHIYVQVFKDRFA